MWAARPHLGSIFEKQVLFSGNHLRMIRQGWSTSPACLGNRNCPWNPISHYNLLIFKGNCDSSDSLLDFCCISLYSFYLLRKCGLLAHTSAAFLKNCCTEKLFICLRFIIDKPLFLEKPPESGSARLGHIPSLPWESQLPLKPYLSLQPFNF